jgi:hypothetical protein
MIPLLVIQGRSLPFDKTDKVPLGYKTTVEGAFAISIDKVDGVLASQAVFIEDKETNVIHNLKNGSYSFTTGIGVFNDRFVLRYKDNSVVVIDLVITPPVVVEPPVIVSPPIIIPPVIVLDPTLGNPSFDKKGKSVIVSVKNHQIKINSFDERMEKVMIYDLRGRLLYENGNVNNTEFVIQNLASANQVLIIKVQLKNEKWVVNQIILRR